MEGGSGRSRRELSRTDMSDRPLRVVHSPLNVAGIPWTNVQALRRKGVDATLVVVERQKLHPEADVDLAPAPGLRGQARAQWPAFARLLPQTDVFHFYFGRTLLPKFLQFPILHAPGRSPSTTSSAPTSAARPEELAYGGGPTRGSSAPTTRSAGRPTPR